MSYAFKQLRQQFEFDQRGLELATLFTVVVVATVALALKFQSFNSVVKPPDTFGEGASGEATAAATWAIAEVVFAGVLLLAVYTTRRLPDWLQTTARRSAAFALLLYLGATAGSTTAWLIITGTVIGVYVFYRIVDHYGAWWVPNNLLSVFGAVVGGLGLGMLFGAVGLAIASAVLLAYDHYFANKKDWMFHLAAPIIKYRLPALFIRPSTWRFDWSGLLSETEDTDEKSEQGPVTWGVGTADMALPAGFVAAVAIETNGIVSTFGNVVLVLFIVTVAIACFRLSWRMRHKGSGAGLPPLAAAVVVPYALLTAATLPL